MISERHHYLLDTNVISELRKPKPHGAVSAWLSLVNRDRVAIPAVVIGEIQAGAEITRRQDEKKAKEIEEWLVAVLSYYFVAPMDGAIFREWARLMVGKSDGLSRDARIAATARLHRLTVVTRKNRDFPQFDVDQLDPFLNGKEQRTKD